MDLKLFEMTNIKIKNKNNSSNRDDHYCSYYYEDIKENIKIDYRDFCNYTINNIIPPNRILRLLEIRESDYLLIGTERVENNYFIDDLKSSLFLFDRKNNTIIKNFPQFKSAIKDILQLKNGLVAVASIDKLINILDPLNNFTLLKTFQASEYAINSLLQLTESGFLVTGSEESIIRIWDPNNNFTNILNLTGHTRGVTKLHEMDNGYIISSSRDHLIKIWDLKIQKDKYANFFIPSKDKFYSNFNIQTLFGHTEVVNTIIQLSSNKLIISASMDNTFRIWDPYNNYKNILTIKDQSLNIENILELSNGYIATSSSYVSESKISIWNPFNEFEIVYSLKTHKIFCLKEFPDGLIAFCNRFNQIRLIYQVPYFYQIYSNKDPSKIYAQITELKNGYYAFSDYSSSIEILNPKNNMELIKKMYIIDDLSTNLIALNNGNLLVNYITGTIQIYDFKSDFSKIILECKILNNVLFVTELDYGLIAIAHDNGNISVRNSNLMNFQIEFSLNYHLGFIYCLKQLKNGYIVSSAEDNLIIIWNTYKSFNPFQIIKISSYAVDIVELPNGDLASIHINGNMKIWQRIEIKDKNEQGFSIKEDNSEEQFDDNIDNENLIYSIIFSKYKYCKNIFFKRYNYVFDHQIVNDSGFYTIVLIKNKFLVNYSYDGSLNIFDVSLNVFNILTVANHTQANIKFLHESQDQSIFSYDIDGNLKIWSYQVKKECVIKYIFDKNSQYSFIKVDNFPIVYNNESSFGDKDDEKSMKMVRFIPEYYMALGIKSEFKEIFVFKIGMNKFIRIQVSEKPISTYKVIFYKDQVYIIFGFIDGSIKISLFANINIIKDRYFLSQVHKLAITDILPYENTNFISCSNDGFISLWDINEPYQEIFSVTTEKNKRINKCYRMNSSKNKIHLITLGYSHFTKWKLENNRIILIKTFYEGIPKMPLYQIMENSFGTFIILTEEKLIVYNEDFEIINIIEKIDGKKFRVIINLNNYLMNSSVSFTAVGIENGNILILVDIENRIELFKKINLNRGVEIVELYESQMGYLFARFSDWNVIVINYREFN